MVRKTTVRQHGRRTRSGEMTSVNRHNRSLKPLNNSFKKLQQELSNSKIDKKHNRTKLSVHSTIKKPINSKKGLDLLRDIKFFNRWDNPEEYKNSKRKALKFIDYLDDHSFVKIRDRDTASRLIVSRLIGRDKSRDNVWNNLSTDKRSGKFFKNIRVDPSLPILFVDINFLSNRKGNVLGSLGKPERVARMIKNNQPFEDVPFYSVRTKKVGEGNHRVDALKKLGYRSVPVYISGAWD
tara:strand:+ start:927 stop:1640 length:714 start_codon:yes stop_codon:yes gene_type:complete